MDKKTANSILSTRIRGAYDNERTEKVLVCSGWYLFADARMQKATLDGDFSADELEAIAAWMRDPKGVIGAT